MTPTRPLADITILIVDDSDTAPLAMLLQRLGAVALSARSVSDAEMKLQMYPQTDVVLMDHHLAGQVGTQLALKMRDRHNRALRISFSGSKDADTILVAIPEEQRGTVFDAIIPKGGPIRELAAQIRDLVDKNRAEAIA